MLTAKMLPVKPYKEPNKIVVIKVKSPATRVVRGSQFVSNFGRA